MKKLVLAFIITCIFTSPVLAKIDLSGAIRNDAYVLFNGEDQLIVNALENKLIFQRRTIEWKFYSDLRVSLFYSEQLKETLSLPEGMDLANANLLRAFIKYYSDFGDITVGKTYINFGNMGVFNPFEIDQNINVSDLNYTKAGLIAATYDFELNDLSVGKLYISPEANDGNASFGGTVSVNLGNFDTGLVLNHLGTNQNIIGIFIKGDLELGVQASWAYHHDDNGGSNFSEVVAGLDYSFFDGKLVLSCMGYMNGVGRDTQVSAASLFSQPTLADAATEAFPGKYYIFTNVTYAPDEFMQWSINSFVHTGDSSSIVIPSVQTIVADGLTLSAQCIFPTGAADDQYSRESYGDAIALIRIEAKL